MSDSHRPLPRSRGGRLVVLGVFWSTVVYAAVAIWGSVATSLYGRPPQSGSSEEAFRLKQRAWCLNQLTGLRDELEAEAIHELSHPEKAVTTPARWDRFKSVWEAHLHDAAARCSDGSDPQMTAGYDLLLKLYADFSAGLRQIQKCRTDTAPALAHQIEALKPTLFGPPGTGAANATP